MKTGANWLLLHICNNSLCSIGGPRWRGFGNPELWSPLHIGDHCNKVVTSSTQLWLINMYITHLYTFYNQLKHNTAKDLTIYSYITFIYCINIHAEFKSHTYLSFNAHQIMNISQLNKSVTFLLMYKYYTGMLTHVFNDIFKKHTPSHNYNTKQRYSLQNTTL